MERKKPNRTRPVKIMVRVSERERALIAEKMEQAGIRNREAYLRKMAIDGYVIHLDVTDIQKLSGQLRRYGNNLNQLAIYAHETGYVGADDLEQVKQQSNELWDMLRKILIGFARLPR